MLRGRQLVFINEYIKDGNAKEAAIRSGYSIDTAKNAGYKLLQNPKIKAEIDVRMNKVAEVVNIDAAYILNGIKETVEKAKASNQLGVAIKGYELLGKYLKLWTDKVEIAQDESLAERIADARKRANVNPTT
jgi:phage terminase small subunit